MNFLKKIFSSLNNNSDMNKYLILGIGNIGSDYDDTRHNIGFQIVDELAKCLETKFDSVKLAQRAEGSFKGKKIVIIKPNNYVNNSGRSLLYWQKKEKVSLENILVVCDDLNLFFISNIDEIYSIIIIAIPHSNRVAIWINQVPKESSCIYFLLFFKLF